MLLRVLDRPAVVTLLAIKELLLMVVALGFVWEARARVRPGWMGSLGVWKC